MSSQWPVLAKKNLSISMHEKGLPDYAFFVHFL